MESSIKESIQLCLLRVKYVVVVVVAQWLDPLTLQPEHTGREDSIPAQCHDEGGKLRQIFLQFFDPVNFHYKPSSTEVCLSLTDDSLVFRHKNFTCRPKFEMLGL